MARRTARAAEATGLALSSPSARRCFRGNTRAGSAIRRPQHRPEQGRASRRRHLRRLPRRAQPPDRLVICAHHCSRPALGDQPLERAMQSVSSARPRQARRSSPLPRSDDSASRDAIPDTSLCVVTIGAHSGRTRGRLVTGRAHGDWLDAQGLSPPAHNPSPCMNAPTVLLLVLSLRQNEQES